MEKTYFHYQDNKGNDYISETKTTRFGRLINKIEAIETKEKITNDLNINSVCSTTNGKIIKITDIL